MAIPVRATYRVQLTPAFGFDEAAAVVPYLARLGVSHLYTSPLEQATPGSTHGYDVTDHHRVRPELGGEPGLRRLWEALEVHGMGHVVDIVPNHMGIRHPSNRWWQDVLAQGPESPWADHFDIDWDPPDPAMTGRVLLPFLGTSVTDAVADGLITVERADDGEGLVVHHADDRWPVSMESMLELGIDADDDTLDEAVDDLAGSGGLLLELLELQHWRAAHWTEAATALNWRRFFDVTDLASVRVELPAVFDDVHALLRQWFTEDELAARVVQGVRVDHVDGLVDPEAYLLRLRDLVGPDRLLVVEKILAADESVPRSWPVDGTTGYEVAARLDEALTPPDGAGRLAERARAFTGDHASWPEQEATSKRLVADQLLQPEVDRVTRWLLVALAERGHEVPGPDVAAEVVTAMAGHLPVYRTYPRVGVAGLSGPDRARLATALEGARRHRPDLPAPLLEQTVELLSRHEDPTPATDELAVRFAQLTAPLTAKAVEDTAFYRAVALPWLDEVGGDPSRTQATLPDLVGSLASTASVGPGTLCPLTTHDTKRSGDVRARMSRLALHPDRWADQVQAWHESAAPHRSHAGPDRSFEWLLWTTLVGAWPIDEARVQAYATKAMREAKVHTSWLAPDEAYESAVHDFVAGVMADAAIVASIGSFAAEVLADGRAASLAQLAFAATVLGSPDLYQGDEVWNLSLVDPDNRRPVDHQALAHVLDEVASPSASLPELWAAVRDDPADDGAVKLALWRRLVWLRGDRPEAFTGPPAPLPIDGDAADSVLAFHRDEHLAVVAPVRAAGAPSGSVVLPAGRWHDVIAGRDRDGGPVPVVDLLGGFPVAVLVRA